MNKAPETMAEKIQRLAQTRGGSPAQPQPRETTPKGKTEQKASTPPAKATVEPHSAPAAQTEKVKNGGETTIPTKPSFKGQLGGARPGSGRKPGGIAMQKRAAKQMIYDHVESDLTLKVIDPKTGNTVTIKKPSMLVVMETLREIGVKERNVAALKEWLDRAVGRPVQPHVGDEDSDPIQIVDPVAQRILREVYGGEEQNDDDNAEDD